MSIDRRIKFAEIIVKGIESRVSCTVCRLFTELFMNEYFSIDVIVYTSKVICITFKMQRPAVCELMIDSYRDISTFIKHNSKLTAEEICGVLIGDFCVKELTENVFWYMNLTSNLQLLPFRRGGKKIVFAPKKRYRKSTFVHITDIHPDPKYTAGTNLFCGDPICCHLDNGFPSDPGLAAGTWGGYLCDPPTNITSDALEQIYATHPHASFWIWTGDNVHHEPYNTTKEDVKKILKSTTEKFLPYLAKGLKIYPSLGNHDIAPLNR